MDKRYKVYTNGKDTVVVTSTYAGKTYKGSAKCNAEKDVFNFDIGVAIARARVDEKIAKARMNRAGQKCKVASAMYNDALANVLHTMDYFTNAQTAYEQACKYREAVEAEY